MELTFEQSMHRLEEIVRALERGDAPLDASLSLFEEGAKLVSVCAKQLDAAEQKVTMLTSAPDGSIHETDYSIMPEEM